MLLTILGGFAPIAVKLIGWWLDKSEADAELKRQFYGFVNTLGERNMVSASLHDSYKDQLARLAAGDAPKT